jgi:antirestriction protein ArdC
MDALGRLRCRCTFTESSGRLIALLDKLEKSDKVSANGLKSAVEEYKKLYQDHVVTHNAEYIHSFVEFNRTDKQPVLKTSAYTAGDYKRARQGPGKKREVEKQKKKRKTSKTSK